MEDLLKPKSFKMKNTTITIGSYSDINGKDSIPLKGIEPTKAEILAIIRHHFELVRSVDEMFASGQSGSWEIRQMPYSNQRIEYYSQFVDESEIEEIFEDVYKGFKEWQEEFEKEQEDYYSNNKNK